MRKLLLPIITPYFRGKFDATSMEKLIGTVAPFIDIFVPGLSSGEGSVLVGQQWKEVVLAVRQHTKKPVFAGILDKRQSIKDCIVYAADISCEGVVLPLGLFGLDEMSELIKLCTRKKLQIILYNSEQNLIKDVQFIATLAKYSAVIGLKDSSMDTNFLQALRSSITKEMNFAIYQGMEMMIDDTQEIEGFCIALANVEPRLCSELAQADTNFDWKHFQNIVQTYNLTSEQWYVTLKAILFERGIIRSAEELVK